VSPSKLLTAAAMLKTIEANQKQLTASETRSLGGSWYENCNVVAVTAEKKVATVERLRRLFAPCSWANRMVGTPTSMNIDREDDNESICSPISAERS